jgi:hypothetical protein
VSASTRRAAHNAPEQSSRPISVINTHIHTFSENSYGISRPRESPNRRKQRFPKRIQLNFEHVELTSPTNFDEIYTAVTGTLEKSLREFRERPQLTFHLSPGTPAMAAIWVILGKTRYRVNKRQSLKQQAKARRRFALEQVRFSVRDRFRGVLSYATKPSAVLPQGPPCGHGSGFPGGAQ